MKFPTRLARFGAPALIVATVLLMNMPAAIADSAATRGFTAKDLVMLDRASDPRLSPDGRRLAFQLRETDYAANKGLNSLWLIDLENKTAQPRRLTAADKNSTTPRWSADGRALYFLSTRSGSSQVWKLDLDGGEAQAVTKLPLDVGAFVLSPDGHHLLVSLEVFTDCATLACSKQRQDEKAAQKTTGVLYDKLFVRHWDTWSNGTRAQLFALALDAHGFAADAEPLWLSKGIDGDVPSKPFGGDDELVFTADSASVIFSARIAGKTEPWSTNFDLYRVPVTGAQAAENLTAGNLAWDAGPAVSPDGKTLAYRAMKRPGFEADRFGIMLKDLASGSTRELAADWDRSADSLIWSADGKTLYTSADDLGQKPVFAIDVASGKVKQLSGAGHVSSFDVRGKTLVYALDSLTSPAQLFKASTSGADVQQLTQINADKLAGVGFGAAEQFSFSGWNGATVHGYVVKPANFEAGKKYPVAFIIHGGPQGSMGNDFHYRWNPQTYAGAGFAVVFIDFHGSTGYGQAFTDAISGHWGDRPLEDLQKGWAHALAQYPFLDGTRAAALGASYGGYMINWIAGNWATPASGAWRALICHDGVFDNRMMAYSTEELWFDEWENQGTAYDKPQNYEQFNPVNHVAAWKVPMLVIHGGMDFRIPLEQGLGAFTALQRRGIASEFLYFPDENHWVLKPQNSVQWHETVLAWLQKWTAAN
ncbi:MAG: peptidase [Nevskia sp.]|nr:peptidase [Nevskia sp.]